MTIRRHAAVSSLLLLTLLLRPSLALQIPESVRQLAATGTLRVAFLGGNPTQGRVDAKTGAVSGSSLGRRPCW